MILNRLIFPEGNKMIFNINHFENDKKYTLAKGEQYYFSVSKAVAPYSLVELYRSDSAHFEIDSELPEGEYLFEAGVAEDSGFKRIILPALDENHRPLNQLIVLRRLK